MVRRENPPGFTAHLPFRSPVRQDHSGATAINMWDVPLVPRQEISFFALRGQEGHVPFTVVFCRPRNISVADSRNQPAAR
jgi:hypothetical protein